MENPLCVIVRFELQPGELETLHALIGQFFKEEVSKVPGFISAKLHQNDEGTVLINYATWESADRFIWFIREVAMKSEISKKIQQYKSTTDRVYAIGL